LSTIRLNKLLATRGIGARRKCDQLIESGAVSVNGEVVTAPGARVVEGRDRITVNGRPIPERTQHRYLLLNKPVGVITTLRDPEGRRTIADLIPREGRLFPVGRLDADTSGLLIVTNDGGLAHHLMHPRYGITKFYRVLLVRDATDQQLARLAAGVEFEPGVRSAPAMVRRRDPVPRGAVIEIALHEGRHRQVRRMCEAVGLTVLGLHRWAYGPLKLGELARGIWRELSEAEVAALRSASARPHPRPAGTGPLTRERRPAGWRPERRPTGDRPERRPAAERPERRTGNERPERRPTGDRPERRPAAGRPERRPAAEGPERRPAAERPERRPPFAAGETRERGRPFRREERGALRRDERGPLRGGQRGPMRRDPRAPDARADRRGPRRAEVRGVARGEGRREGRAFSRRESGPAARPFARGGRRAEARPIARGGGRPAARPFARGGRSDEARPFVRGERRPGGRSSARAARPQRGRSFEPRGEWRPGAPAGGKRGAPRRGRFGIPRSGAGASPSRGDAPRGRSDAPRGRSNAPRGGSDAPRGRGNFRRGGAPAPRGRSTPARSRRDGARSPFQRPRRNEN
jgi:23S rRNA pseudouridine2605 synthase